MENENIQNHHRSLPWACELVWAPISLLCGTLHFICNPLGIEPAISCLLTGGFFGMVLIPLAFVAGILYVIEVSGVISPESLWKCARWVGVPFCVYYVVVILILNKLHVQVKQSNPSMPRNVLEHAATKFLFATQDYFPMTCVPWEKDAKLPSDRQYVFAVHPHGIHCTPLVQFSTPGSAFDQQFPNLVGSKLTGLAATVMFKLPLVRELFLQMGYVDASRSVASKILEAKRSIYVCTGGEEESMYTTMGKDIVVLKKRKGFVRLALSYGADIVPVFGVGNSDLYRTYRFLAGTRLWLQKTCGVAIPIFHGKFGSPVAYQQPVQVLIGKPIPTPLPKVRGGRPDEKLVEEYHSKYLEALRALHAQNVQDRTLEIR